MQQWVENYREETSGTKSKSGFWLNQPNRILLKAGQGDQPHMGHWGRVRNPSRGDQIWGLAKVISRILATAGPCRDGRGSPDVEAWLKKSSRKAE